MGGKDPVFFISNPHGSIIFVNYNINELLEKDIKKKKTDKTLALLFVITLNR